MHGRFSRFLNLGRVIGGSMTTGLAVGALALGLPTRSDAALLSIASGTAGSSSNIVFTNTAGYGIDLDAGCAVGSDSASTCVSVTAPGPLLAGYNYFSLSVFPVTALAPAVSVGGSSTYVEQYALSAGSPADDGTITIGNGSSGGTNPTILSANVTGYSLYGANGGTSALIELDLANAVIGAGLAGFTAEDVGAAFLDVTGTALSPISIQGGQFTGVIDIDWSGTVSTTPYAPVPLPKSGWLMLGALVAWGLLAWRRHASLLRIAPAPAGRLALAVADP
jgi:hypothetical protein